MDVDPSIQCLKLATGLRVAAEEDALPFAAQSLDLVVSGLSLQLVNDLPGALVQINRSLKPDGLLLAALLAGETLKELREAWLLAESEMLGGASPRVAPICRRSRTRPPVAARRFRTSGRRQRYREGDVRFPWPSCERSRRWAPATCSPSGAVYR